MGANVDAGDFAEKLPNIVREIQRNRMGRGINNPTQNVAGSKEIQLAGMNRNPGMFNKNGQ